MISTNEFKNGLTLEFGGELYSIVEYQHVKPGKGGAFVRTKLKNLRTQRLIEKTFRVDEKFQEAFVEEKILEYLYRSTDTYHFMDQNTLDEVMIQADNLSSIVDYLKENIKVKAVFYKNEIIEVKLPIFVELKVTHTEPGIKGDTARNAFKPATLETGAKIDIPLFINENDVIKIDTRTGKYVERV